MTVNGLPVQAVVDTGAEATVISEEVYNKLPIAAQKPLCETSLKNVGVGSKMSALGELEVTLEIGSQKLNWKVHVGQIHDSLLLGLDAMQAAGLTNVAGRQVFIGKEPVPSQVVGGDGKKISVAHMLMEKTYSSHAAQHGWKTTHGLQAQILTPREWKDMHRDQLKHPVRPPEQTPNAPQPGQLDWILPQTDHPKNTQRPPTRKTLKG